MSLWKKHSVVGALEELADRDEQQRLWLSDGSSGDFSSFTEIVCEVFDGGVTRELESGKAEEPRRSHFLRLRNLLKDIPEDAPPQEIIDDPRMEVVRETSMDILKVMRATK